MVVSGVVFSLDFLSDFGADKWSLDLMWSKREGSGIQDAKTSNSRRDKTSLTASSSSLSWFDSCVQLKYLTSCATEAGRVNLMREESGAFWRVEAARLLNPPSFGDGGDIAFSVGEWTV